MDNKIESVYKVATEIKGPISNGLIQILLHYYVTKQKRKKE